MKQLTAFFSSLVLSPIVWIGNINPVSAQGSCQGTIDAVAREIRQKGAWVRLGMSNYTFYNAFNNSTRVNGVVIALKTGNNRQGYMGKNVLSSSVLLKSYATKIFNNCGGTGYIRFGADEGEVYLTFGMTDDGILTVEKCSENAREITNRISGVSGPGMDGYCAYVIPDF
jgi:hypothetical protein